MINSRIPYTLSHPGRVLAPTSRKSVRTQMARHIIAHLVHGTWGRGFLPVVCEDLNASGRWKFLVKLLPPPPKGPLWFETNSPFREALLANLAADVRDNLEFREFLWSGSNSISARAAAAADLRIYLQSAFAESPDACHLLVAHSHGGVVAFDAVTQEQSPDSRTLDGIFTLGTPYLSLGSNSEAGVDLLLFGLIPKATLLFFAVFLPTLALAGHHAAAIWLLTIILGAFLSMRVIPANEQRPFIRTVADILFILCCLGAVWGAYTAGFSLVPLWHVPPNQFSYWEHAARYPAGVLVACATLLFLLASRVGVARGAQRPSFMLRDTVRSVLSVASPLVIVLAVPWALASRNVWTSWFFVFLIFWLPATILLMQHSAQGSHPVPPSRSAALWNTLREWRDLKALPCPLDALRLPGDEASLAIAASLIARELADLSFLPIISLVNLRKVPRWLLALLLVFAVTGVVGGLLQARATATMGSIEYVLDALIGLVAVDFALIVALLLVVTCLCAFSMLSIGLVALAIGPEVNDLLPVARVDCEPLPRCASTSPCRFAIDWDWTAPRSLFTMRHALYNLDNVQQRVAHWITERAHSAA